MVPPSIPPNKQWHRVEHQKFSQPERRQNEQEVQYEAETKFELKKEDFMIQKAKENANEILNTQGAEGIIGGSKNNCVIGDCTKMLSKGGGAKIFPIVWKMKGK